MRDERKGGGAEAPAAAGEGDDTYQAHRRPPALAPVVRSEWVVLRLALYLGLATCGAMVFAAWVAGAVCLAGLACSARVYR
jgi:hypothetical protein